MNTDKAQRYANEEHPSAEPAFCLRRNSMFSPACRRFISIVVLIAVGLGISVAQIKPAKQNPNPPKPATQTEKLPDEPQDVETLKTDTDLVTVPVIATNTGGVYITDLSKEE